MKALFYQGLACSAVVTGMIVLGPANAGNLSESEPNNTLDTAQRVDAGFGVGANPDIVLAESWSWVSVSADGDGTFDLYAFEVTEAGVTGYFDIDYGAGGAGSMDTEMCLFGRNGEVLIGNDDSNVTAGAGGSASGSDSYIEHVFAEPGTYVIGVGRFNTVCNPGAMFGNAPDTGHSYVLQISLTQHVRDSDGDGVADAEDCNPYSDRNPTVFIGACDTGAINTAFADGCTVTDRIMSCATDADHHGKFVSCVSSVAKGLLREREITRKDKGMLMRCAAGSGKGRPSSRGHHGKHRKRWPHTASGHHHHGK
jgi:hypothetical protein